MTLNLQSVLAIIGVFVVLVIYLVSKWQNRMPVHSRAGGAGDAGEPEPRMPPGERHARGIEPVLRGLDTPRTSPPPSNANTGAKPDDIPVLETPLYATGQPAPTVPPTVPPAVPVADITGATEFAGEGVADWQAAEQDSPAEYDAAADAFDYTPDTPDEDDAADQAETRPAFSPRSVAGFDRLGQIDYWVKITGERDVGRETVLAIYREAAADFTKPHSIHGLKMPQQEWRDVEHEAEDARFADLVVTIQLADHDGAIGEREMTRFSMLVSKLSEGTGRQFLFMAPIENAIAQAAAIAEFAAHFDSVFVVNIRPQGGAEPGLEASFDGAIIDYCAGQMGLERDHNCFYTRFKTVGKNRVALYSLANRTETGRFNLDDMQSLRADGLTFFTRPALNRSPGAVFTEMVDTAKAFASRIQGVVSAPGHDDLADSEIETTRQSIEQVAARMDELGIAAGSEQAARIFSRH